MPRHLREILAETRGMIANAKDFKSMRHLNNYVLPMLSKQGQQNTFNNVKHLDINAKKRVAADGPLVGTSHHLEKAHNGHAPGTEIKIKDVFHDKKSNMLHANTEKHGVVPLSRVRVPENLAKKSITVAGINVEKQISSNLGTKNVGNSTKGFDYSKRFSSSHELKGKVSHAELEPVDHKETYTHGDLKGESKLLKGNFGTSSLTHNKETKKWSLSNGGHMASKFAEAVHPQSSLKLLDHMNKYHSNGIIKKGFNINPAKNTSMHYLKENKVNSLHAHEMVHEKVKNPTTGLKEKTGKILKDVGTSYTFGNGNNLKGVSKLAHLPDHEIHKIDGKLKIESTKTGTTRVSHSPNQSQMKNLANRSVTDPENHRSLYRKDHAEEFVNHVKKHVSSNKKLKSFTEAFCL